MAHIAPIQTVVGEPGPFLWYTSFRARASASWSPDWSALRTALRAVMSRSTEAFRTSGGSAGLAARHSGPRTTR